MGFSDIFDRDIVVLGDADPCAVISNPVDFFDRKKLISVLRHCRAWQGSEQDEPHSDYELFRALTEARNVMAGHREVQFLDYLLKNIFSVDLSAFCGNCKDIWTKCVDDLLKKRLTILDLEQSLGLEKGILCVTNQHDCLNAMQGILPILNANSFLNTTARDWDTWSKEMQEALNCYAHRGSDVVYLDLPMEYKFVMPNLYDVNKALNMPEQKRNSNLLLSQIMRFLADCKKTYTLVLRVECAPTEVISLLSRIEQSVGLPNILWVTPYAHTRDALLEFATLEHKNQFAPILFSSDFPSDIELDCALNAYSARYPAEHLYLFSGCDIRYHAYEKSRIKE